MLRAQSAAGDTARHLADLVTGSVLIRETMSPAHRVQAILKGEGGRGSLIADAHPDGITRGLVQLPDGLEVFNIGDGSHLQMMRSMARGEVHRSIVQAKAGDDVPRALMTYMQESEQIVSMIATGVSWRDDDVMHAGGFVVQLLPGAQRGPLMVMTERLEGFPVFDELLANLDGSPKKLLEELLHMMPFAQLDKRDVSFGCRCSMEAVVASLASLSRQDIKEMVEESQVIELSCDYCNTDYVVQSSQLQGLLAPS